MLGQQGPMARNLQDLALFSDVMIQEQHFNFTEAVTRPHSKARIAFSEDLGITHISDDILKVFHQFITRLENSDYQVSSGHPDFTGVHDSFDVLRAQDYAVGLGESFAENADSMKPEVQWNIQTGLDLSAEQITQAIRDQGRITHNAEQFLKDYDVLICPATSVSSVGAEQRYPGHDGGIPIPEYYRWLAIAYATTLVGLPVITIPCGTADNGMPVGIQIVGRPKGELHLFQVAAGLAELTDWSWNPIDPVLH